jgi:molybdopterin-binding protein
MPSRRTRAWLQPYTDFDDGFDKIRFESYKTVTMHLLTPQDAARELSVSYPTLKQWIYRGKLRTVKTPGGHHRISSSEIDRLTGGSSRGPRRERRTGMKISGRNKLKGTVTEIKFEGLLAEVTLDIGGQFVTSIITKASAEELGLAKGVEAVALIKATEVMMMRSDD